MFATLGHAVHSFPNEREREHEAGENKILHAKPLSTWHRQEVREMSLYDAAFHFTSCIDMSDDY